MLGGEMALDVVGRDEELSALRAFLDRRAIGEGPFAIALEGEAGIGKSTLWRAAVQDALRRGRRVLSARPAESERDLAYAGLGDLLEGVLDDLLPELSAPRRRALEVALLVEDAAGRPVDQRALGVAVRSALELLSEDELLIAIDDLQWLDDSTASALGFALRRLPSASLQLLWTRRPGATKRSTAVEDALESERIEHVLVGPLSVGAIHQILHDRLCRAEPRPTLLRLHEVAAGNPFYALELARALGDGVVRDPTQPLPVPERLEELVSARLAGFTGPTRDALVLSAAQARLTPAQLLGAGIERTALDPALAANVIELTHGGIRFTHPLLASVLYQGLSIDERQEAHLRVARIVDEPLAHARHLALSTEQPDAELAAALEQAAAVAGRVGAPIGAAELGEHALRLTPPGPRSDADRRATAAARAHLAAGDVGRARLLAQGVLDRAAAGPERAAALALLADVEQEGPLRSIPLMREALEEPGSPPALQAALHQRLSLLVRFTEGLEVAEQHACAAVAVAEEVGDTELEAAALAGLALIRFNAAKPGALELAKRAHALVVATPSSGAAADAGFSLGHVLFWSCQLDRARSLLVEMYDQWSERDEREAAYALWYLSLVEFRAGRFVRARELAESARSLSAQYAHGDEAPQSLYPLVLAALHLGDLEAARELAVECCRLVKVHGARTAAPMAMLAVVELWSGDHEAAIARFEAAEQIPGAPDVAEPSMCWWRAEQVEALLETGRHDDAVSRLDQWEGAARRLGRDWVLAHATRCRGLAAAGRGDVDEALVLLTEAVELHEDAGDGFGRARALLALGVTRRRARQKRPAREALELARTGFEELEAAGWAERARDELGAIGGRTRSIGLTPSEQRVADLVAEGRTNAEVAAALFLAERTVASHLTHVYSKLSVRSRTELARKLADLASKVPMF
jgi:DNA-binding CsgD family transcriptional regulator